MTEKVESLEIFHMRGHSRGEWYGTLDDVAKSDQDAEYWAVFGTTHRGNKHCLGEFETKQAAISATRGISRIPGPRRREALRPTARRIVQLEIVTISERPSMVELIALCDDGTVWHRGIGVRSGSGLMDHKWEQIPLDGIESD